MSRALCRRPLPLWDTTSACTCRLTGQSTHRIWDPDIRRGTPRSPTVPRTRASSIRITRDGVRTIFVRSARIGRDKVYGYDDDASGYALFSARSSKTSWTRRLTSCTRTTGTPLFSFRSPRARATSESRDGLTIHNLAYQGRTSADVLKLVGLPRAVSRSRQGERILMARAITIADIVSTVTRMYADEILTPEFGERLEGLLRSGDRPLGHHHGSTRFFARRTIRTIPAHYDADVRTQAVDKAELQKETACAVEAGTARSSE